MPNCSSVLLNVDPAFTPGTLIVNVTVPARYGLWGLLPLSEPLALTYDIVGVPPMIVYAGPTGAFVPGQITHTPKPPAILFATAQFVGTGPTTPVGWPETSEVRYCALLDPMVADPL